MRDRKKYKTNPNSFGYVCGKYSLPVHQQNNGHKIKTAYKYYFSCKVADQNKKMTTSYLQHFLQHSASPWAAGKQNKMPFAVSLIVTFV